jgi:predicted MPP superfamily phosphohydrolase
VRKAARAIALLALLALIFLGAGFWNATRTPVVVETTQHLSGLAPGIRLRVLLLSDTHYGQPDMPGDRLDRIVAQANALKPDLILLAGDYNGGKLIGLEPRPHLEPAVAPLGRLKAPLGVFAVNGNHDGPPWTPIVMGRQGNPVLLVNRAVDIGPLVVAGADSISFRPDMPGLLKQLSPGRPVLLLLHEGDALAGQTRPLGLSVLALAGHTHGGQVVLPLIGSLGRFVVGDNLCRRGACRVNGWPLYVTSGVGTSWLPIRYGVPPELVLITLEP